MMYYWFTLIGLYFELIGAFLLAVEAIGPNHLLKVGEMLKKHRLISVIIFIVLAVILLWIAKQFPTISQVEAMVVIFSLGILVDFAPKIFSLIVKKIEKGTAGFIGFILFSLGFMMQAIVNLSQLRQL